jgi:hypothetical protein
MRPKAPLAVLAAIVLLTVAAGVLLLLEGRGRDAGAERAREYQQLVGGLGFGPALDLSRCANSFDPRLCPCCPAELGPIPAGRCFCPQHACSILAYPALDAAP